MALTPNRFQVGLIKAIGIPKYLAQHENKKGASYDVAATTDDDFIKRENRIWYMGDASKLEFFYKTNYGNRLINTFDFYRVVNTNMPRAHYPLASSISNAFGSLLFSQYPKFVLDTGSVARDKTY